MRSLLTLVLLAAVQPTTPPAGGNPGAAAPWEGALFAGAPSALAAAAAALPVDGREHLDILRRDVEVRFELDGTATTRALVVFRPLSPEGVRSVSAYSAAWRPGISERPVLRARVVSPAGVEHVLDPTTIVDVTPDQESLDVFTDARQLRAPLPGVEVGAVVEVEYTAVSREALPGAGHFMQHALPRSRERGASLTIDAPLDLPLHYALPESAGRDIGPDAASPHGRRRLAWRWRDVPKVEALEPEAPGPAEPAIVVATGRSWATVAQAYRSAVEPQLTGVDVERLARELAGGVAGREEVAQRILDWMGANLRYTGLELGLASLVPAQPGTVLRRRYGDCKDFALLFVALMRALGHEAHLAIVRVGEEDVEPRAPSLSAFNHAVAYVGGVPALWIDVTWPELAAGLVSPVLQGRRALVIRPGEQALEVIPSSPAGPDDVNGEREIRVVAPGRAEVRETVVLGGGMAAYDRSRRRHASPQAYQDAVVREAKQRVRAADATVEGEVEGPARVVERTHATGSTLGSATDDTAEARLEPRPLRCAPDALLPWTPVGGTPRKAPLRVARPCRRELRQRVVVSSGLRLDGPLPAPLSVAEGPLRFEATFAASDDGAVTARFRLELGRGLLTADQVKRVRVALGGLGEEGPLVKFRRTSLELLEAGKGREALDELRRLIAAEPAEVGHRIRLALALQRLGLGEAARDAAREAVRRAPDSGWANRVLEVTLEADLLGRRFEAGCDRAGAVAAQRKAAALEADAPATLGYLGGMLLYGDDCRYFGRNASPAEAVKVLQSLPDIKALPERPEDLMHGLLALGRDAEAVSLARDRPSGYRRNGALLAGLALSEGVGAAASEAARLSPSDRGEALGVAAVFLGRRREYLRAAELLERAADGADNAARHRNLAAWLRRAKRLEPIAAAPRVAEGVVGQLALAGVGLRPLAPLLAASRGGADDHRARRFVENLVAGLDAYGIPEIIAEVAVAAPQTWEPSGDDGGRLQVGTGQVFLVREPEGWKVLAVFGEMRLLAERALVLLDAGRAEEARRWLAWAIEGPYTPGYRAAVLEPLAFGPGDPPEALRLLAAVMGAPGRGTPGAVQVLEAARGRDLPGPARQAVLVSIADLRLQAREPEPALAALEAALQLAPRWRWAQTMKAHALAGLGRHEELRQLVEQLRREIPLEPATLRELRRATEQAGDLALTSSLLQQLAALPQATTTDLNEVAWSRLFTDGSIATARGEAQRAVDRDQAPIAAHLHTLATVLAASGEPEQAMAALRRAVNENGEVRVHDWLVIGRVAEAYGMLDEARAAWRRVVAEGGRDGPLASANLAERWLSRLERAAGP